MARGFRTSARTGSTRGASGAESRRRYPTADDYLNDPRPTCPGCSEPKDTVRKRLDPYWQELYAVNRTVELCADCAHERYLET